MNARFLLVIGALLMAPPVMAESLVNLSSKHCLDTDGRAVNGGIVRMWKCVNHPNQGWTVDKVGSSLFRLKNRSSNFCLDTDGSRMNGAQVRMWGCVDHPNQLWEIHNLPTGSSRLKNKASGFCLDSDGRAENRALVRMWECVTHPNQSWQRVADDLVFDPRLERHQLGYWVHMQGKGFTPGGEVRFAVEDLAGAAGPKGLGIFGVIKADGTFSNLVWDGRTWIRGGTANLRAIDKASGRSITAPIPALY